MNSNNTIYTIQTHSGEEAQVVQIETMISRGLYRFTILGMSSKHASDAKDRVYSALRSNELLNLKSDNRKIIVTLSPEETPKKEHVYDLGIALSCISCIDKHIPTFKILALGGLSISGKVIATKRIYQALYSAYLENILVLLCSPEDISLLDDEIITQLQSFNIHIVTISYLRDAVIALKEHKPSNHTTNHTGTRCNVDKRVGHCNNTGQALLLADMDTVAQALYISLCGGHNLIIETQYIDLFQKVYKDFYLYTPEKRVGEYAYKAHTYKLSDDKVCSSILYIENIKNSQQKVGEIQDNLDSVVSTYRPCSCGYQYSFFTPDNTYKKMCVCSKRSLIQHKRHIENTYFEVFDMKETYISQENMKTLSEDDIFQEKLHKNINTIRRIQFFRYIHIHNIETRDAFFLGNMLYLNKYTVIKDLSTLLDKDAYKTWKISNQDDRCIRIAQTIQDILNMESDTKMSTIDTLEEYLMYIKTKPVISDQALLLALSYIPKMDF